MAKLFQYENPFSGKKESVFDVGSLLSKILGVAILFFVFATGQNVARKVSERVPAIDTRIENPIYSTPVVAGRGKITI